MSYSVPQCPSPNSVYAGGRTRLDMLMSRSAETALAVISAVSLYERAGRPEVVVPPAVLAIGLGPLPLPHFSSRSTRTSQICAPGWRRKRLDDDQVLARLQNCGLHFASPRCTRRRVQTLSCPDR